MTEDDTLHTDNFFRRQRGEDIREKEPKKEKKKKEASPEKIQIPALFSRARGRGKPTATQESVLEQLRRPGIEIHEELALKRKAAYIDAYSKVLEVKAPTASQIDGLVKAGYLVGTLSTGGTYVRWKLAEE